MPKEYFSVTGTYSLAKIDPGARIHVIGVAGVAMAQLAVALVEAGFQVSGSDKECYEPMSSLLKNSAVKFSLGYRAENIPAGVSLVVIGNAVSYGNPEIDVVEKKQIPYTLFTKALYELVIKGKHSIVVTGTHGKTTTTAMMASLLTRLQQNPGFFIGGVASDLASSFEVGSGPYSVVEGDEYDSAFFAKVPKFTFYRPDTCIVNAIEYDHADIYPDLKTIEDEFTKLILSMPVSGTAIVALDFSSINKLLPTWRAQARCKIVTFGTAPEADFVIISRSLEDGNQRIAVRSKDESFEFSLHVPGEHNCKNALAALLAAKYVGLDMRAACAAISKYGGSKRRQEVRFNDRGITLIEDFAHHPTAVVETLKALREWYPNKRIWAVFEPRSNSSRRKVFQKDYIGAFKFADQVVLADVQLRANDQGLELLKVAELVQAINAAGVQARLGTDVEEITRLILQEVKSGDLVVVMSNGSFGGLIDKLIGGLKL